MTGNQEPNRCWIAARPGVEAWASAWAGHRPPRHSHDSAQISLTRAGQGVVARRGDRLACPPGAIVVIGPGEVHEIRPLGEARWVFDTLFVDERAMAGWAGGPGLAWRPAGQGIAGPFGRLHRAVVRGAPLIEQEEHLAALAGWLAADPAPRGFPGGPGLHRVREFLDECPGAEVSLASLAELADLAPSHLSRSFRRAFGLPPHAYLVQARVRRARALLGLGEPIAEVAARVGFADQAHLTRHFRRLVGVTPGAYRRGGKIVQDPGPRPS